MKRIISGLAVAIALAIPVTAVALSSHSAPIAGGYGDWPLKQ